MVIFYAYVLVFLIVSLNYCVKCLICFKAYVYRFLSSNVCFPHIHSKSIKYMRRINSKLKVLLVSEMRERELEEGEKYQGAYCFNS